MYRNQVKFRLLSLATAAPFVVACGGSFPPPTQRLADAQGAERSAREVGASSVPSAQLSLKLAQDGIAQAEKAMAANEYERADSLLRRAQADADLNERARKSIAQEQATNNDFEQIPGFRKSPRPPTKSGAAGTARESRSVI